jgi:hypothetical protein
MESLNKFEGQQNLAVNIIQTIQEMGIGHMSPNTALQLDKIAESERAEIIDTYKNCSEKIESLLNTINSLINEINTENRSESVFSDLVSGIKEALYKTLNQILYNATTNPAESLTAFDELTMMIESVNDAIVSPKVVSKKKYPESSLYQLEVPENMEGFSVQSFDTLFSKDHIAFNLVSNPIYQDTEKTIKSGIRIDYGPLYKETEEGVDKTKTQWVTSVDISGYYIDKIMNKYSPRGHHFTKVFAYKINLLMQGFANHMESHFDEVKS